MQNDLTRYFLQYHHVCIPYVGTFHLVQQPAHINFIDKEILPPMYSTEVKKEGSLSEHQLDYLARVSGADKHTVKDTLSKFGRELHDQLNGGGFNWKGIGQVTGWGNVLPFTLTGLAPVPAHRIQREFPQHDVLVGDQHVLTDTHPKEEVEVISEERQHAVPTLVLWGLLLAAILIILYVLYTGGFSINSTGLQSAP